MRPCAECGQPCEGKAITCSEACRVARHRATAQRCRDRKRGGPRTCVVCGKPITAKSATKTCSPECRLSRRRGKPLEELPTYTPLAESVVCDVCGLEFRPWRPRQKGCSEECMRRGRLARKLATTRKGPFPERPCLICSRPFVPIRERNVVCADRECRLAYKRQLAAERYAGVQRPGDTQIFCVVCGSEVWAHRGTLVCAKRECILARQRQLARDRLGTEPCSCIVCGERFWPPPGRPGAHYTCSARCSRVALLRKGRRAYQSRRDELLAEQARRLAEDPEYRERRRAKDARYRERRAARELQIGAAQVAAELERRVNAEANCRCPDRL